MPSSPEPLVARARIALGTLVEIALPATCATEERFGAAFAAIEHVHRRMSPRDPASDLARIAGGAHRGGVTVDRETHAVLALAFEMHAFSRGAFSTMDVDVSVRMQNFVTTASRCSSCRMARGGRGRTSGYLNESASKVS